MAVHSQSNYSPITLSGIVQQGGASVKTKLTVRFHFHMLYLTRDGTATTLSIVTGPNVTFNTILDLPFIQQTKMIIDAFDQVADIHALNALLFDIDFWRAMTVPKIEGRPNVSNTLVQYADIIRKVDSIVALYANKSQPASILLSGKRTRCVGFDSSIAAPAINANSSTVTIGSSIEPKIYDMDRFSPLDLPCSA